MEPQRSPHAVFSTNWVWRSSAQSLVHQQISVLALAEVLVSMAPYWWFASITPWPFLTLVAFLAVPFLLLRSPESVREGQEMFRKYWGGAGSTVSNKRLLVIMFIAIPVCGLATYVLSLEWLEGSSGFILFLRGAALGASAPVIFIAIVGTGSALGSAIAATLGAAVGATIAMGLAAGAAAFVGGALMIIPSFALGLLVRVNWIRAVATLKHLRPGLAKVNLNSRESLAVVDLFQIPQLLPGVGAVNSHFDLVTIWRSGGVSDTSAELHIRLLERTLNILSTAIIVIPAILYRTNIKANAWLWGTLAYALSPRTWGVDFSERSKLANLGSNVVLLVLLSVALALFAVLGQDWLPEHYSKLAKSAAGGWLEPLIDVFHVQIWSLRWTALVLLLCSLLWLIWKAFSYSNANSGVLTNPSEWSSAVKTDDAQPLRGSGLNVLHALKWVWVCTVLNVWVFTFWAVASTAWGQSRFPHVMWAWLRPYL
jgi:hypothetical protein